MVVRGLDEGGVEGREEVVDGQNVMMAIGGEREEWEPVKCGGVCLVGGD